MNETVLPADLLVGDRFITPDLAEADYPAVTGAPVQSEDPKWGTLYSVQLGDGTSRVLPADTPISILRG